MESSRRTFIQASGMAAVVGASGLAGCGLLGGDGGPTSPAGEWQYDPSVLTESPNVVFGSMNYGALYDMREDLPPSMQEDFQADQSMEDSPFSLEDFDQVIGVGGGRAQLNTGSSADWEDLSLIGSMAITGSFDRDEMVQSIEEESESEVTQSGEYEGYTIYEVPDFGDSSMDGFGQDYDGSLTAGVSDSAVVLGLSMAQGSNADSTGTEAVEAMVDASAGNGKRLSNTSGPAQDLQSRLNDDMFAVGVQIDPDLIEFVQDSQDGSGGMGMGQMINGMRGVGLAGDIAPDTTTFRYVLLYDSATSAENSGVLQFKSMTDRMEQQEGIEEVSIEQDGAAIVATLSGDTETLGEQGGPTGGTFDLAPSL